MVTFNDGNTMPLQSQPAPPMPSPTPAPKPAPNPTFTIDPTPKPTPLPLFDPLPSPKPSPDPSPAPTPAPVTINVDYLHINPKTQKSQRIPYDPNNDPTIVTQNPELEPQPLPNTQKKKSARTDTAETNDLINKNNDRLLNSQPYTQVCNCITIPNPNYCPDHLSNSKDAEQASE